MPPTVDPGAEGSGLTLAQLWHHHRRYPYLLARVALAAGVLALLYLVLRGIEGVLFPVLVSLLLAYVLDPAIDAFEARGLERSRGILLFLCLGGVGVLVFALFLYPTIAHLIGAIGTKVPRLLTLATTEAIPWAEATFGVDVPANLSAILDEYGATLQAQVPGAAKTVSGWISGLWAQTGALLASMVNLVTIPVFTFYFLRDFDRMKSKAAAFIPLPHRQQVLDRLARADEVVGAYIRGQVEVAAILAALYAIGLGVVLGMTGAGVTSGVAIGLLAGLLNVVPYLGFLVGFVLSVAVVLVDWAGWGPFVGVLAVFGVVQALEGNVITPRIVGDKVGLSPVTVIIVLLLGGELMGLLGVVLAIPIAGAVGVLLPDIIAWYKASNFYTGAIDDSGSAGKAPESPAPPSSKPDALVAKAKEAVDA